MGEKQDLRVQKTYLSLTNAFTQMLEEMPFEQVTVNELCNRAMVRRATFYKHFADKYDFFGFYVKEIQHRFLRRNERNIAGLQSFFLNIVQSLFDFIEENQGLVESVAKSSMLPYMLDVISEQTALDVRERLEEEARMGVGLPGSPEVIAQLFAGALIGAAKWWVSEKGRVPKAQVVQQTAALLSKVVG
ncbi:MAG: TetR/AcrR family transcriptional regulator [Eggerthellaceae bacterium]